MGIKKIIFILVIILLSTGCKEKKYTITFETNGGNVMQSIALSKGKTIENIDPPIKEGYLFVHWLKDGVEYNMENPVTEDITLTASWIETPKMYDYYNVIFVVDDQSEKTTVKENETVNEPKAPKKENYQFVGWFVGEEKFDFNTKITKDITLVAKYKLDTITVTYDLDGGEGIKQEIVLRNSIITIPDTPIKQGHKFLKWTLEDKEFSFDSKITEDITLKAIWEPVEYLTISFDTDGGNVIEPIIMEKYSKLDKLPTPIKDGYVFKYWSINNEIFDIETTIENGIMLKAIYEEKGE